MEQKTFHPSRKPIRTITGGYLLSKGYDPDQAYDISIANNGKISDIKPHDPTNSASASASDEDTLDAKGSLIGPSLCHAHVHIDKCFLLNDPKYADLEIEEGDFAEAMKLTATAKARFAREDLLRRGKWLISESIDAGVTHMRVFVEVDHVVGFKCLDAAVELKQVFEGCCVLQICAFAQEAVLSGPRAGENRRLWLEALKGEDVEVVGCTPYVEDDELSMRGNARLAVEQASDLDKHLDLHLDYHLDAEKESLVPFVIDCAMDNYWTKMKDRGTIALGHCTRLTLFNAAEWHSLRNSLESMNIHFIGLPTSDLFIQGKPSPDEGGGQRPRGTLQIPQMIQKYGLNGAISINNVGNAFTPQGNCDPLSLASMGVGIYQAGTKQDAQVLYECVSNRAKESIGLGESGGFVVGAWADLVVFGKERGSLEKRGRKSVQELIYDPPSCANRRTIFRGCLIEV